MSTTDLRRELAKAKDVLEAVETYLAHQAQMNAALHTSQRVMFSPLHTRVTTALYGIHEALNRTDTEEDPCS